MPALAAELVWAQVTVIATVFTPTALAAQAATTTIPIVVSIGDDPVKFGSVAALNRPGGIATGICMVSIDLRSRRPRASIVPAKKNEQTHTFPECYSCVREQARFGPTTRWGWLN
jgi:ABC transporter substrate binding protein